MAGQIRRALDTIIRERSHGDATLVDTTKTRLLIKGFDYGRFTEDSPDDDAVLHRLRAVARDMKLAVTF
jgi:hypothetical protein